jgi:hypothetical protein
MVDIVAFFCGRCCKEEEGHGSYHCLHLWRVLQRKRQWQLPLLSSMAGVIEKKKAMIVVVAFFCGGCFKGEKGDGSCC